MLDIVLDEARVQKFFNADIEFVEKLDECDVKTYRQNNDEIAIVIDLIHENITEKTLKFFQIICERMYFRYGEKQVNLYVITLGCNVLAKEHSIPSPAVFTIKLCCRDFSIL